MHVPYEAGGAAHELLDQLVVVAPKYVQVEGEPAVAHLYHLGEPFRTLSTLQKLIQITLIIDLPWVLLFVLMVFYSNRHFYIFFI